MPIITLQRRARELGRIRIGQVVKGNNGRSRPSKLDRFRLTSASKPLLDAVASLYGGEVVAWTPQNGGPQQWEVVTDATRLPVLVPPQPVSQYFELWSGGGCQRRCDGERELLSDSPCLCVAEDPDPQERSCKPTTRLNVILRDVEGIGVWRLESHGYYSATELPEVAEFLARTQGYVAANLALEERVVKRNGETRRFMVPALEVDITPAQLLAGGGTPGQLAAAPAAAAALPAGPSAARWDEDNLVGVIVNPTTTLDDLRKLWAELVESGAPDMPRVKAAFDLRVAELKSEQAALPAADPAPVALPDENTLWQQILTAVPADWSTTQVEEHFQQMTGVAAENATSPDMAGYLDMVKAGAL